MMGCSICEIPLMVERRSRGTMNRRDVLDRIRRIAYRPDWSLREHDAASAGLSTFAGQRRCGKLWSKIAADAERCSQKECEGLELADGRYELAAHRRQRIFDGEDAHLRLQE